MKFTVENLGKVGKAEIDLKPLTIFIGKNGSGKTYVASALWAFVSHIKDSKNFKNLLSDKIYDKYHQKIKSMVDNYRTDKKYTKFDVEIEDFHLVKDNINNYIKSNFPEIMEDCLKYKIDNKSLFDIKNSSQDFIFSLELDIKEFTIDNENTSFSIYYKIISKKFTRTIGTTVNDLSSITGSFLMKHIIDEIFQELILTIIFNDKSRFFNNLLYIPAARTGLMFGLNNFFIPNMLSDNNIEDYTNILTAPLADFVNKAFKSPMRIPRKKSESNPLIEKIMGGNLSNKSNKYYYTPYNLSLDIPLSASSSLVTEVAALDIFNDRFNRSPFVIFEEPEAHLHLSAQREMAKLIVKMINQGCYMLITTHSDTFLQQLNNLIMLNKLSKNNPDILQEFNIKPDETIAGEKVAVYDFQCKNEDKSTAIALELGDYGFIAPSVNDEINNLIRQTDTIIDMIDDLKSNGE